MNKSFLWALAGAGSLAMPALHAQAPAGAAPAAARASAARSAAAPAQRTPTPARAPLAPSAQKAVEERTPVEDEPAHALSPGELQVAREVHVGDMQCEQGAVVNVRPLRTEGFFLVSTGKMRFRMHPVESRTGAVRLEDPRRGAMWLQLGNKSMLMSQKLGRRLADECQSPEQVRVADAMRENPPPSLLDPSPARPRE